MSVPLEEAANTQAFHVEQLIMDLALLNATYDFVVTFTDNDGD